MAITVYVLDGAGTVGRTSNIVDKVTDRLRWKTGCKVEWVTWAASLMGVGGTTPWPEASRRAVMALAQKIRDTDDDIVLVGYSAGCRPVREFLEQHPELRDRVVAVAMLSDPWQPANRQQHGVPDGRGFGIMGQKLGPIPGRTFWCGHPDDPICRALWDSLLRYATASADADPGRLIAAFVDKASRGRLQLIPFLGLPFHLWFTGLGARIERSVREAQSYLGDGHDLAYTREFVTIDPRTGEQDRRPLAHRLADSVAWAVRNDALAA